MPANLTPQYHEAEEKYRRATTDQEKLASLQEMLKLIPKHKGTEKLQAEIKRKIAEQKKQLAKKSDKKAVSYAVDNCGHPQVVFIGAPNSGRSQLISTLTGAFLKVADHPYTTRLPHPAMMTYENVKIQLVDTPPISASFFEPWLGNIIRAGDAVVWTIDLQDLDILENLEAVKTQLEKRKTALSCFPDSEYKPVKTLVVGTKSDSSEASANKELICELYPDLHIFEVSAISLLGIEELKKKIFEILQIIRIYSKPPGKKADRDEPIILPAGSTVLDLARHIHRDLADRLKSARIWNSQQHSEGQNIPRDQLLQDENIVELTAG